MEENVIRINVKLMTNVDMSVKHIAYVKILVFESCYM